MKLILLTEYFPESEHADFTGGVESRCFYLAKELSKTNDITILCSRQPGQLKESTIFNAKIIRCGPIIPYSNSGNIFKRLIFSFNLYLNGKKLTGIERVEGASFLAYPPAYFLGKKFSAKKVATWHETWIGSWIKNKGFFTGLFGTIWERFSLKLKWDEIISVSEFTKHKLIQQGIEERKIKVIPNGIELERFRHLNISKEKIPTICYFGRLNWQKNIDILIKAVSEIEKIHPKIQCKIIGSGPAEEELKKLAAKLNLNHKIHFFGHIKKYNEMLKEAKKSHIFVQPSTLEGFGITVIEASALGLPYVISDIPPFKEITHNGKGGEIFQQMDVTDLSQKIIKLLTQKKYYNQKLEEGKFLVNEYDWKKIARSYLT